ncbi:MAG TPA: hypothetical protein VKH37_11875, partial [Ferruginibacter sp.]|nr:hypothetical protein [Ferruginibacter sp.]
MRYWLCQIIGWGGWSLTMLYAFQLALENQPAPPQEKKDLYYTILFIEFLWGILATHILRIVLKQLNWMRYSTDKVVLMFIIGVAAVGLVQYYGAKWTEEASGNSWDKYINNERLQKAIKMEQDSKLTADYYLFKGLPGD